MNGNKRLAVKLGFGLCSTLAVALTGCITDDQQPRDGGAYYGPSGQAGASYAEIRTESDFYEPLSPYGRWEVVGSSGRCWIPGGVDADWSPYSNGYWQRSDAGWYWASDEPWGWATYHYGRWDSSPQYGWYWVPQTQWAPAWVSWREGGGYVGWAPLGPSGRGVVEVNRRGATPGGYVFVEERRFLDPVRRTTITVNNTVINKTVINEGPRTAVIEQASGRKMQAVPVRQLRSKEEAKVVAQHPTPTSTREKAVPPPVQRQAEKTIPVREPRQVEQPAMTTAAPQPPATKNELRSKEEAKVAAQHPTPTSTSEKAVSAPVQRQAEKAVPARAPRQVEQPAITTAPPPATKNEVRQADRQNQVAKLDEQKRVQQENARAKESEKAKLIPVAVKAKPQTKPEAKPETKPEAKVESKPVAERPAATREPTEQKAGKDDEKKD